jgi:hypothetical protein
MNAFLLIYALIGVVWASSICDEKTQDCVTCTNNQDHCVWCANQCHSRGSESSCKDDISAVLYPDTCPIIWPDTPTFLSSWMSELLPVIGYLPLLDLGKPVDI